MGLRMLLRLDLQYFSAEGGEFGGYDPSTAYEGIEPSFEPQVQPEGQGELVPEYQEPQVLDFGGRKLPATDDSLLGLHKDFTEQQRYITALQDQVNAYKQMSQMVQQQQAQPQVQPQAQEISANVADWNEDTWQKFYDKPHEIIGGLVQQEIQKFASEKLDPILQERHWNNEIQNMYNKYPDFDQYVGAVQNLVDQYPDRYASRDGGLEEAYFRAVATSQRSPQQLAQDPQFLNQYVYNNPDVQQQMRGQYFQTKQQTNQQLPTVMGRGAGGFTPQTPDSSPTTLREASQGFLKNLGYR